jgi:Golgi nucleoside diphosphatase
MLLFSYKYHQNVIISIRTILLLLLIFNHFINADKNTYIHSNSVNIKPTATRGMVIDAGSGGSRLHVYQWKPRIFNTVPPPLSYPEQNEHWTARMDPGIHTLANNLPAIGQHLATLIDFAKVTLVGYEDEFADYPIYFKATGGMRELPVAKREAVLAEVQKYLSDKSFCPFYFRNDFARVISGKYCKEMHINYIIRLSILLLGEEEAIFSWTATNFLKGTLLQASHGLGEVKGVNTTFGTIDLGGASTQIAFYLPSQDILDGLYKLQIGGQREWNVYTKSFLQFGKYLSMPIIHISIELNIC